MRVFCNSCSLGKSEIFRITNSEKKEPKGATNRLRPLQVGLCAECHRSNEQIFDRSRSDCVRTTAQRCYHKGALCTPMKMATKKAEHRRGSRRSRPSRTQVCSRVLKID